MVHAFNTSTWEVEIDLFDANLVSILSSKPVRAWGDGKRIKSNKKEILLTTGLNLSP